VPSFEIYIVNRIRGLAGNEVKRGLDKKKHGHWRLAVSCWPSVVGRWSSAKPCGSDIVVRQKARLMIPTSTKTRSSGTQRPIFYRANLGAGLTPMRHRAEASRGNLRPSERKKISVPVYARAALYCTLQNTLRLFA